MLFLLFWVHFTVPYFFMVLYLFCLSIVQSIQFQGQVENREFPENPEFPDFPHFFVWRFGAFSGNSGNSRFLTWPYNMGDRKLGIPGKPGIPGTFILHISFIPGLLILREILAHFPEIPGFRPGHRFTRLFWFGFFSHLEFLLVWACFQMKFILHLIWISR